MLTLEQVKSRSTDKIAGLIEPLRVAAVALIERSYRRGVVIGITQGLRTYAEQTALYNQGRTVKYDSKGNKLSIVTNAPAGYSYHNFGVAFDFVLLSNDGKQAYWDVKRDADNDGMADWMEVVEEAKALGMSWGGDFISFKDNPHFEMPFGLSTAQYRAGQRPTAAQQAAAIKKIKDGDIVIKVEDANDIIQHLKAAWAVAKGKNNAAGMKEANRLANVLRVASGQKEQ